MALTSYIERSDLVTRFNETEVAELETLYGTSDPSVVPAACLDATAEADSYLARVHVLPLPAIPEVLKAKVCDIARYKLYKNRATEEVQTRYDNAIRWFVRLTQRKVILTFDATVDPSDVKKASRPAVAGTTYRGGVFNDDALSRMVSGGSEC